MTGLRKFAVGQRSMVLKLMLAWALSILTGVMAMLMVVTFQMTNRLEAASIQSAQTLLSMVETQTRRAVEVGDIALMAETVHGLDRVENILGVTLFHEPTLTYMRSDVAWPHSINQPSEPLEREVLATGRPGQQLNEDSLRLAIPLFGGAVGDVIGVIGIELKRPTRVETMTGLFLEKLLVAAIGVGCALILAYHFARKLVRPINTAIRVADRVAEGDLAMPERIGGSREAAQLELSLSRMIFRLEQSHMRIRDLAFRDQVTRLSNRADFNLRGRAILRGEAAEGEAPLLRALFFLDLDGFKAINDTYGHEMGDRALRLVADRLREVVRPDDELRTSPRIAGALGTGPEVAPLLARLGGDEFTLLLSSINSPGDAEVIAYRVLDAIRSPMKISGKQVTLSVSIGISLSVPSRCEDFSELLRRADVAMYVAKKGGKDSFRIYDESFDRTVA
ncbi:MAG: diguanylate cyclase [Pseudomonadota bacterium]